MTEAGRFRYVLAVCGPDPDEDSATLALADEVAAAHDSRLGVLAVAPPPPRRLGALPGADTATIRQHLEAERRTYLDGLVRTALPNRSVATAVRTGKAFLETVHHVRAEGHDLVIKTAEEIDGVSRRLLASTDQHLLRKCPATVWLRRAGRPQRPGVVMAAVDVDLEGSDEPETEAALNRRILDRAAVIAAWAGARLHVVTVWDSPDESLVRAWSPQGGADSYARDLENRLRRRLDDLASESALPAARAACCHVERGSAHRVLPEVARRLGADLLVLGTVARTGVPGLIIGNTAEDILNSVDIPLVAVKPPGYVSPVRAVD